MRTCLPQLGSNGGQVATSTFMARSARRRLACTSTQVASFSSARYVLEFLKEPLTQHWETSFIEARAYLCQAPQTPVAACSLANWTSWVAVVQSRLTKETAKLAEGHSAVCLFVNDDADAKVRSNGTASRASHLLSKRQIVLHR